ncbi:PEP/pyruvate-binding domain-containing protein [Thermanaerothrix daxensis]|uniref:PEP/pyruvate-binding domain-containing protein n=1 Tax=Thermanaerothrix daxensis TaxID=869279 RepID=UPI0006C921E0|nr:PEP/pyruvate-binding domain-containing protein [Thermanaerothrix daxensis]
MGFPSSQTDRLIEIYLTLGQYPILSSRIRERMRRELYARGLVTPAAFEAEARELAVRSQSREGLRDPFSEEPAEVWEMRLARVRDQLTDLKFSQYLTLDDLERLIAEVLSERGVDAAGLMLSINPELAPIDLVFEQALTIERLPPPQRARYEARLQETKVVLIRHLISDQLPYVTIARRWFTVGDLLHIRRRKIGPGRIGGKAAGMILAHRILQAVADLGPGVSLSIPESYFLGADVHYAFMAINNLYHWNDQKYKTEAEMRAEYPQIVRDCEAGEFPPDVLQKLEILLSNVGKQPLIVRSSSLLEDNFGTAFAGKYESIFLPNQGTPEENLHALTRAIARVYASTFNPNALLYRRERGLLDYDERMAILIQVVQGERYGRYFLPQAAGVAFSRNLYRWAPQIRREDGFVRLVWGLGTRAVERVGNDFPRLVALSHPLLHPSKDVRMIRRYSQQYVDVIDLEDNTFKTLPVAEVLKADYPALRYLAQVEEEGFLTSLRGRYLAGDPRRLVLTFEDFLRRTPFAAAMRQLLRTLETHYGVPVDVEFTAQVRESGEGPHLHLTLLQCRPQSQLQPRAAAALPHALPEEQIIFRTHFVVPEGTVERITHVVFIPPETYFALPAYLLRQELARAIGRLNTALAGTCFIMIGPGRWGSSNPDLGVPVGYGDVYHARALVELTGHSLGLPPEPSLGTHFFQDLLESQIYPLAIDLDDRHTRFARAFFYETPNRLHEVLPNHHALGEALRLIRVSDYCPDHHLDLVMSDEKGVAVAFLHPDAEHNGRLGTATVRPPVSVSRETDEPAAPPEILE